MRYFQLEGFWIATETESERWAREGAIEVAREVYEAAVIPPAVVPSDEEKVARAIGKIIAGAASEDSAAGFLSRLKALVAEALL